MGVLGFMISGDGWILPGAGRGGKIPSIPLECGGGLGLVYLIRPTRWVPRLVNKNPTSDKRLGQGTGIVHWRIRGRISSYTRYIGGVWVGGSNGIGLLLGFDLISREREISPHCPWLIYP